MECEKLIPQESRDDEQVVRAAILRFPFLTKYASDRLRDDKEFIMGNTNANGNTNGNTNATGLGGPSLEHVSDRLKNDKEVVFAAVRSNPFLIKFASERCCDDDELMEYVSNRVPNLLPWASKRLRDDENFVRKVMGLTTIPQLFQWASKRLKDKHDLVSDIIEQHPTIINFATERVRSDVNLYIKAIGVCPTMNVCVLPENVGDSDELGEVVTWSQINRMSLRIRDKEHVMERIVRSSGLSLQHASHRLRDSEHIVRVAIDNDRRAISFASPRILGNLEMILYALEMEARQLRKIRCRYSRTTLCAFQYASFALKDTYHAVLSAIQVSPFAYWHASPRIRTEYPFLERVAYLKIAWTSTRWPRLVWQALRFQRLDKEMKDALHPENIRDAVNQIDNLEHYEGPEEHPFWTMVMSKKQTGN